MAEKCKYKDMAALAAAFKSGELDKDHWRLQMDNDGSHLGYVGPLPEGLDEDSPAADEWREKKEAGLFRGQGYADIVDACNAAGIPTEWV